MAWSPLIELLTELKYHVRRIANVQPLMSGWTLAECVLLLVLQVLIDASGTTASTWIHLIVLYVQVGEGTARGRGTSTAGTRSGWGGTGLLAAGTSLSFSGSSSKLRPSCERSDWTRAPPSALLSRVCRCRTGCRRSNSFVNTRRSTV